MALEFDDGRLRRAGRFNATTSVVSFGAVAGAQLCTAQTILAYCKPEGSGEGGFCSLLYRTASGTANGLRLHIDHNAGTPRVFFGGSTSVSVAQPSRNSAATITYGQWHHIAAQWDGGIVSSGLTVYTSQNGAPLTVASPVSGADGTGAAANNSADPLTIGNRTGSDRTFNGLIGYVARWNRVLSVSELALAQRRGPLAVPAGLIMLWTPRGDIGPYGLQPVATAVVANNARPARIGPPRPFEVVTGSGTPITISGNVGNAVAAGVTGLPGVAIEIAGAVGNAVAAGIQGAPGVSIDIAATAGNAVAAGVTGAPSVSIDISGAVGNAVAAGVTGSADVSGTITIDGNVGNAVAAGVTGSPGVAITITASVGDAAAAGVSGSAGFGISIDGSVGAAAAAGLTGSLSLDIIVAGVVGNSVAAGVTGTAAVDGSEDDVPLDAPIFSRTASAPSRRIGRTSASAATRRIGSGSIDDPAAG